MADPQQEAYRQSAIGVAGAAAVASGELLQRMVDVDNLLPTFDSWVTQMVPIVRAASLRTSALARADYFAARAYQRVDGPDPQWIPAPFNPEAFRRSMFATAGAALQGVEKYDVPGEAIKKARIAAAGSITRYTMDAGRNATIATSRSDPRAIGSVYLTKADDAVCYWCAMLASRGPVFGDDSFKDADGLFVGPGTAKSHDHCRCVLRPVYREDTDLLDDYHQLEGEWRMVTRDPENPNVIKLSGKKALRAWRSYWDQRQKTA